jgi:hypothetical protein
MGAAGAAPAQSNVMLGGSRGAAIGKQAAHEW